MKGLKKNKDSIQINEKKQYFNCKNHNTMIIINSDIETLIIEGSENLLLIEGGIINMIIDGNNNKILTGIESFGIKNLIFKGNYNNIKIQNPNSQIKIIDDGYYNFVFRKKKNLNSLLNVNFNLNSPNFLSRKRVLNVKIQIEDS